MDLELDETQRLLQETVRSFLEREVPFDRIRKLEKEDGWDRTLWDAIVDQGWLGLLFSSSRGGTGGSLVDAGLLLEEFARRAAIVPILEVGAAGLVLDRMGAEKGDGARVDELIDAVLAGDAVPVPALLEREDRFDRVSLEVVDGTLNGEKSFVDYGQFATHHLVSAIEGGAVGLYAVDASAVGVACLPLRSVGRTPLCKVRYRGVPADRVGGADACADLVRFGRALASVQCVGAMQQALDMTVAYAGVREQFGAPIATFQAVRHHCANMAVRVASARSLAYEALDALDAAERAADLDVRIAAAKASASRAAPEVTMMAHQIHGGNGVIEENDLYFFTLRAKERSIAWGTIDECLAVMSRDIAEPIDWL